LPAFGLALCPSPCAKGERCPTSVAGFDLPGLLIDAAACTFARNPSLALLQCVAERLLAWAVRRLVAPKDDQVRLGSLA
jgi:hypothetical protein